MGDTDDGIHKLALAAVAGVVALVLAGSIALAVSSLKKHRSEPSKPTSARTAYGPVETIYFAQDNATLNVHAVEVLKRVSKTLATHSRATVAIASFVPLPVEAERNPRLGYQRALAVRRALEASGIVPDRISIVAQVKSTPASDLRKGRRIELRIE